MARTRFKVKEGLAVADDNSVGGYPLVPVGTVLAFAGSSAPEGWLLCDGSSAGISRTTYANLFAVIGTTYGSGDGSTTFNLPDARGRNVVGVGSGSGLTSRALAATGGVESVTISSSNLPTHQHTLSNHTHVLGSHTHTLSGHTHTLGNHTHTVAHSHTGSSGTVSSDHAHNIPRGPIATAGTNRAVVSTQDNQPTFYTAGISANHTHSITVDSNTPTTSGPSADSGAPSSDVTGPPSAGSNGPSVDATGNGGFANTPVAVMNPFLALNYIIKY